MSIQFEQVNLPDWPFKPVGIAYGQGRSLQLEVVLSEYDRTPTETQLRGAWKTRQDRRGVPLLVVVLANGKSHVCGASGDDPTVYLALDNGQVERIYEEALGQPNRQAALRSLRDSLGSIEEESLPGLRNEGFLAYHELINRVPDRSDWNNAKERAKRIIKNRGTELLDSLGFAQTPLDNITQILRVSDHKTAIAILLKDQETPEAGSERIPGALSPVSYALNRADEENLEWVILVHGPKIRLYPVKMLGVGRRGRTETFLECHMGLIPDEQAAYVWLLFSAEALTNQGSLWEILSESRDFAGELASKLRERIYDEVIPRLAEGLAQARNIESPSAKDLDDTYKMAMRILFRLLFIAYGEDKDLLPYKYNGLYKKRSLKSKAKDLLEFLQTDDKFGEGDSWWQEVKAIFHAVDKGNSSWGVPAYNGGLFSSDISASETGAALEEVSLPDSVFGPVLQHLLLVPTNEGVLGPVDFRSLGVREFGTIYEGLLESELSVAETGLAIETKGKNKDVYRPAKDGEDIAVPAGKVYLHNASGARKSTGSYYTKQFAVEHLLDRALEPALTDHFSRLDELDELEAAEAFFDFRVADISMGSGHFLIAAVDRIEARFSGYLSKRHLAHVFSQLNHQRHEAINALGDAAASYPDFEDNALLRRLIARRCIYGVDINEVAVQLARLAVWIHTFVPGLPLSLLDRNLVHGNSLIGIGQLDEIEDKLNEKGGLFSLAVSDFIGDASDALSRMGRLADANLKEVKEARKAWHDASDKIAPAKALCDIVTAARINDESVDHEFAWWGDGNTDFAGSKGHQQALKSLEGVNVFHFPIAFPEVFLRERAGFDVILGNPPWEEAMADEDAFWALHFPGLRSLNARDKKKMISSLRIERPELYADLGVKIESAKTLRLSLSRGPFPGMGTGDPDLYKAFCWRFWFLTSKEQGRIGVVLPRSVLAAKGSEEFRWRIFKEAAYTDVTTLLNTARWAFDMEARYTVALLALERSSTTDPEISLAGPYNSYQAYLEGVDEVPERFPSHEVLAWNESASLPLLPSERSVGVIRQLQKSPHLDFDDGESWYAKPYAEFHATNDKHRFDLVSEVCPEGFWHVYKGSSFDLWEPDTGEYYAWADPVELIPSLQRKRERNSNNKRSVFSRFSREWIESIETLPCKNARIVLRTITRATDTRTVRAALIPKCNFITNHGPYLVFPRGDTRQQTLALGVLSSIPLDWYARRFVEVNLNFFILNPFPIPRPDDDSPLRHRVIELAGRLACPDERFADWANEVGVECGPLEDDIKQDMIHELDAVVAHLYGLSKEQLTHIFETFHVGWDYEARLNETLIHFDKWEQTV